VGGATAYEVSADTSVIYTGDFRFNGGSTSGNRNFVKKAKGSSVLIIEGTRVSREDVNVTEREVYNNCLSIVDNSKNLS